MTLLEAANGTVKVLETDLVKKKKDVTRLKMNLANVNLRNSKLHCYLKTTRKNLTSAQAATQGANQCEYSIKEQ